MTAVLSLGSNLGDRAAHLRVAVDVIGGLLPVVAESPRYETAPVGGVAQPAYLNAIVLVDDDDPLRVWAAARVAEATRGRARSQRWGPRTLDVDVVSVDGVVRDDPVLTLPHPRAHERAFVLRPWLDVDADAELPLRGPVWWLLRRLESHGVRRAA